MVLPCLSFKSLCLRLLPVLGRLSDGVMGVVGEDRGDMESLTLRSRIALYEGLRWKCDGPGWL
jgi:hypothetical protein